MGSITIVKESALSPAQRELLAKAPADWGPLPSGVKRSSRAIQALERCGFVQTECDWEWSKTDPGAGSYRSRWRRRPAPKHCTACGLGEGEWMACESPDCGELK